MIDLVNVDVHHHLGTIFIEAVEQFPDQFDVLGGVAHGQTIRVFVRNDDRLRPSD